MPAGAAGGDGDVGGGAELLGGDLHVGQEDLAGFERDAAERGVADGARLLVDLLEHEVLVAGLFGLDGVPGDALDFQRERLAVEVGEGDAGGGEDGDLAILRGSGCCACGAGCRGRRRRGSTRLRRCR